MCNWELRALRLFGHLQSRLCSRMGLGGRTGPFSPVLGQHCQLRTTLLFLCFHSGSAFPTSSLKGGLAFYQMSDMCWKLPVSMVTGNFTSLSDSLGVDIRVSPHFQVHGIAHT